MGATAALIPHHYHAGLVLLSVAIASSRLVRDVRAGRTYQQRPAAQPGLRGFLLARSLWDWAYGPCITWECLPMFCRSRFSTTFLPWRYRYLPRSSHQRWLLYVVSRASLRFVSTLFASGVMGSGIVGTHYIGMAAMRLLAMCMYEAWIVAASVLVAIVVSGRGHVFGFPPA